MTGSYKSQERRIFNSQFESQISCELPRVLAAQVS
jgi:hypothetical protein